MSAALRKSDGPLLDRARRITAPTLFLPGMLSGGEIPAPVECIDWTALVSRLRQTVKAMGAAGRKLVFTPCRAAYPDLDPFWAISVRVDRGDLVCMVADCWADEVDMTRAVEILRRDA